MASDSSLSSLSALGSTTYGPKMKPLSPEGDKARFLGKERNSKINKLFRALVKLEGSDLHLKVGCRRTFAWPARSGR